MDTEVSWAVPGAQPVPQGLLLCGPQHFSRPHLLPGAGRAVGLWRFSRLEELASEGG